MKIVRIIIELRLFYNEESFPAPLSKTKGEKQ